MEQTGIMENFESMMLGFRVSVLLARRNAGEPTGVEDVVAIEEEAMKAALPIATFLGRMADPDGDAFVQELGWESAPLLNDYLKHGLTPHAD